MFEDIVSKFKPTEFLWNILNNSNRSLSKLVEILEALDKNDLIRFQLEYKIAALSLVDGAPFVTLDNGDKYQPTYDHTIEFSEWVVSLGKEFYEIIRTTDMQELVPYYKSIFQNNYFSEDENMKWKDDLPKDTLYTHSTAPHLIAYAIYDRLHGEDEYELCEIVDNLLE